MTEGLLQPGRSLHQIHDQDGVGRGIGDPAGRNVAAAESLVAND